MTLIKYKNALKSCYNDCRSAEQGNTDRELSAIEMLVGDANVNWHSHSGIQVLIAIDGTGYYQEKGKPVKFIENGEVIFILPNVLHWHMANSASDLTDVTVPGDLRSELVTWLQKKNNTTGFSLESL